jgi:hypothetical protein
MRVQSEAMAEAQEFKCKIEAARRGAKRGASRRIGRPDKGRDGLDTGANLKKV